MKKLLFILVCGISLSFSNKEMFHAKVLLNVTPNDAQIYVNEIYTCKGFCSLSLGYAKQMKVRIEKEGYATKTIYFKYEAKVNDSVYSYDRGENSYNIQLNKIATD